MGRGGRRGLHAHASVVREGSKHGGAPLHPPPPACPPACLQRPDVVRKDFNMHGYDGCMRRVRVDTPRIYAKRPAPVAAAAAGGAAAGALPSDLSLPPPASPAAAAAAAVKVAPPPPNPRLLLASLPRCHGALFAALAVPPSLGAVAAAVAAQAWALLLRLPTDPAVTAQLALGVAHFAPTTSAEAGAVTPAWLAGDAAGDASPFELLYRLQVLESFAKPPPAEAAVAEAGGAAEAEPAEPSGTIIPAAEDVVAVIPPLPSTWPSVAPLPAPSPVASESGGGGGGSGSGGSGSGGSNSAPVAASAAAAAALPVATAVDASSMTAAQRDDMPYAEVTASVPPSPAASSVVSPSHGAAAQSRLTALRAESAAAHEWRARFLAAGGVPWLLRTLHSAVSAGAAAGGRALSTAERLCVAQTTQLLQVFLGPALAAAATAGATPGATESAALADDAPAAVVAAASDDAAPAAAVPASPATDAAAAAAAGDASLPDLSVVAQLRGELGRAVVAAVDFDALQKDLLAAIYDAAVTLRDSDACAPAAAAPSSREAAETLAEAAEADAAVAEQCLDLWVAAALRRPLAFVEQLAAVQAEARARLPSAFAPAASSDEMPPAPPAIVSRSSSSGSSSSGSAGSASAAVSLDRLFVSLLLSRHSDRIRRLASERLFQLVAGLQKRAAGLAGSAAAASSPQEALLDILLAALPSVDNAATAGTGAVALLPCREYFQLVGRLLRDTLGLTSARRAAVISATKGTGGSGSQDVSAISAAAASVSVDASAHLSLARYLGARIAAHPALESRVHHSLRTAGSGASVTLSVASPTAVAPGKGANNAAAAAAAAAASSSSGGAQRDDEVLAGLLTLATTLAEADPAVCAALSAADAIAVGGARGSLVSVLFEECLFRLRDPSAEAAEAASADELASPRCLRTASRAAAFKLLVRLCGGGAPGALGALLHPLKRVVDLTSRQPGFRNKLAEATRAECGYCGLRNLGCICYMNAMLQQLFMVPHFRYGVLSLWAGQPAWAASATPAAPAAALEDGSGGVSESKGGDDAAAAAAPAPLVLAANESETKDLFYQLQVGGGGARRDFIAFSSSSLCSMRLCRSSTLLTRHSPLPPAAHVCAPGAVRPAVLRAQPLVLQGLPRALGRADAHQRPDGLQRVRARAAGAPRIEPARHAAGAAESRAARLGCFRYTLSPPIVAQTFPPIVQPRAGGPRRRGVHGDDRVPEALHQVRRDEPARGELHDAQAGAQERDRCGRGARGDDARGAHRRRPGDQGEGRGSRR